LSKERIIIGSRGSKLALTQTHWVKTRLEGLNPHLEINIQTIATKGDKITDVALSRIGGKGLFTKELEVALQEERIDLAVHSLKDLPTELPHGLTLGAVPEREDAHDLLISRNGLGLHQLPIGARIGTSSLRRKAQILSLRRDLQVVDLRGNLDTRLRKLDTMGLDAIVVARAGVLRLGAYKDTYLVIPFEEVTPAVGQGALAIECREGDGRVGSLLGALDHPPTRQAVEAERALLYELEGGCQVPIGAIGQFTPKGLLELHAVICSLDGSNIIRGSRSGSPEEAKTIGVELAHDLLKQGGKEVLREIREKSLWDIGHNGN
jgi:hydroxymethylbilane synthase